jgi:superfamily II helicase
LIQNEKEIFILMDDSLYKIDENKMEKLDFVLVKSIKCLTCSNECLFFISEVSGKLFKLNLKNKDIQNIGKGYENIVSFTYFNQKLYFVDILGFFYSLDLNSLKIESISNEKWKKLEMISKSENNLILISKK